MSKITVFLMFLFLCFSISGYSECLNEEKITEECIKEMFVSGEYGQILRHIDEVEFKNKNERQMIKTESFFKISDYENVEKNINRLPAVIKNTLYYRLLALKSAFARKRFAQTLEMIEIVRGQYPFYYVDSDLECIKADIMLYRKQYDPALENYDRCLKIRANNISSYNRILALEKNGAPKTTLIKDYIEYLESYYGTFLSSKVIDRLVTLKEKNNFPNQSSPFYSRWLVLMRRSLKLDLFFNDDFMKVSHPANLEIIRYLVSKNRFTDALKMLDTALAASIKDTELSYIFTVEKYRTLVASGAEKAAAEFMVREAERFSELRKERLLFFAGTIYFDAGFIEEARKVLEDIVYNRPSSKYFFLALYKLGLIYLNTGNELYAFTLWTNYIYNNGFNASKYISGTAVYESITGLIQTIDRVNGFCTFTTDIDFDCPLENICQKNSESRFVTYYDFLYFHLIEREEFKNRIDLSDKGYVQKWKENSLKIEVDEKLILERISTVSKASRALEPVSMISEFASFNHKDGIEFYLNYINSVTGFNDRKREQNEAVFPEKGVVDELIVRLSEFKYKTNVVFKHYFNKTGDLADLYYNQVNNELTYSPHYGRKEDWKLIYPTPFIDDIAKLSVEFDVPIQLIYSIMRAETFYRDYLSSNVGALGLMQIMPATFEKITKFGGVKVKDPMNPYDSLKASVWYLSKLLKRFDNNYIAAIAAYNAGPHRVSEWITRYKGVEKYVFVEMIPFHETRNYVKKVVRFFEIYSYLYEGKFYDLELKGVVNIEEVPDIVNF